MDSHKKSQKYQKFAQKVAQKRWEIKIFVYNSQKYEKKTFFFMRGRDTA